MAALCAIKPCSCCQQPEQQMSSWIPGPHDMSLGVGGGSACTLGSSEHICPRTASNHRSPQVQADWAATLHRMNLLPTPRLLTLPREGRVPFCPERQLPLRPQRPFEFLWGCYQTSLRTPSLETTAFRPLPWPALTCLNDERPPSLWSPALVGWAAVSLLQTSMHRCQVVVSETGSSFLFETAETTKAVDPVEADTSVQLPAFQTYATAQPGTILRCPDC